MGQARRRGTFKERKAQAIKQQLNERHSPKTKPVRAKSLGLWAALSAMIANNKPFKV